MNPLALWHINTEQSLIRETFVPNKENLVEVKSTASLISIGTEGTIARGQVPQALYEQMKVPFMEGDFLFPIKYGYSVAGRINSKEHPKYHSLVHVMHPHQSTLYVPEESLSYVPEGISGERACLASNMETAVNAVWDAGVSIGDKVLIIGFGIIGAMVAGILKDIPGLQLTVAEKDPHRRQLIKALGFRLLDNSQMGHFDLAFHTSGSSEGLQQCIEAVDYEGKVIELSWYGKKETNLQLGGSFHSHRKQLISSQVSQIPSTKNHRWTYSRRKELVFDLLRDDYFGKLITHRISLDEAPRFFNKVRRGTNEGLGCLIQYH